MSDDEFHETFEDISSTSGSDSADEGSGSPENNKKMRITKVAPVTVNVEDSPLWTPSSFQSKFSVWKDDPSSINERRQRFFKQMGLKSSRDEPLAGEEAASGFRVIELVSLTTLYLLQYVSVCSQISGK